MKNAHNKILTLSMILSIFVATSAQAYEVGKLAGATSCTRPGKSATLASSNVGVPGTFSEALKIKK